MTKVTPKRVCQIEDDDFIKISSQGAVQKQLKHLCRFLNGSAALFLRFRAACRITTLAI